MLDRKTLYRTSALLLCLLCPGSASFAKESPEAASIGAAKHKTSSPAAARSAKKREANSGGKKAASRSSKRSSAISRGHRPLAAKAPTARSIKLTSAFLASAQLRPMAQQLAATRSAAAYGGVLSYAQAHPGEGAAAAYLALGHAYALDHRYADAVTDFTQAKRAGDALDDYADYLGAQAAIAAGRPGDAYNLLDHFADHYPDSIFADSAPVLLANAHLQQADGKSALAVLEPLLSTPASEQASFRYSLGRAYQLAGDIAHATPVFKKIYEAQPLSYEAIQAATQLQAMGTPLTAAERKVHADALFNAKRY